MNIIVQETPKLRKIVVQKIETKIDEEEVLDLLTFDFSIEISFLNILCIPKSILLHLEKHKSDLKITVNESILKTYLIHLGFTVTYINNYTLQKQNTLLDFEVLAIGGSAGSLHKFITIISSLPKSNLTIFIIMHQKANATSTLAALLQQYTSNYKVVEATSQTYIQEGTIYTAPPNKHLLVKNNILFLDDSEKRNFSRPSISTTFESLSNQYTNKLVALLVCGYGQDGSDALETLHTNNSFIMVEKSTECVATAMIEHAMQTGKVDADLCLSEIITFIINQIENELFTEEKLLLFLEKIKIRYGYDYMGYNQQHLQRRIRLFYNILKPKNPDDFEQIILKDKNIFKDFALHISVNITTFYRNPSVFKVLRENILPQLDSFIAIKIWCAGCSSGEEVYSIALFLQELGILHKSLIYATDLNEVVLAQAKNGLYSLDQYNIFLQHYYQAGGDQSFSRYFKTYDKFVAIDEEIQKHIVFFQHNLALENKINDFQLIFCRNVLIYFDLTLKEKVFTLFENSLDSYGFLVLGESESLRTHSNFKTIDSTNKIYMRNL